MDKKNKNVLLALFGLGVVSSLGIQLSFIWGSQQGSFSLASMMLPLCGMLLSMAGSVSFVGVFFIAKWMIGFAPLTFGIPTACEAANWSLYTHQGCAWKTALMKMVFNIFIPALCIFLFVIHPVGSQAFVYSWYWLIPIAAYVVQLFFRSSFFLVALSSAFIAHAVGSVMWLYTLNMPAERWIALIPIVACERLVFTLGSFLVHMLLKKVISDVDLQHAVVKKRAHCS